jgi:hypothetical protein
VIVFRLTGEFRDLADAHAPTLAAQLQNTHGQNSGRSPNQHAFAFDFLLKAAPFAASAPRKRLLAMLEASRFSRLHN